MGKLAVVCLVASALAGAPAPASGAQLGLAPCGGESNEYACGHVTVPLDPSGATPGTIVLALRRHRASIEGPNSAVIALAGGPGQSAIPFASSFAELLGPIVATRDLIVFDQRGTGLSHALSCPSPKHLPRHYVPGQAIVRCAGQIGPARAFYTTPNSVADIEAIRRAGGYEKLVLYGTSYGTKVAEQYAQAYPTHVEALVLDSVVPPNGPEPFSRPTFAAVPRVLREECAARVCARITPEPVSDLSKVVARMHGHSLAGRVIDGFGRAQPEPITADDLLGILLVGDFSRLLRAEFIPAVRAAADGDDAPLARLLAHAEGGEEGGGGDGIDAPLYLDTTCEEEDFPWSRSASPQTRFAQAKAQLDALPASAFAPFTSANALSLSDVRACSFWPFATPAPPVENAPLPNVPTLILSGAADLRTPTSEAQEVAAQIPDAHLLVVPETGHSVLTSELGSCARDALLAMFANKPIERCRAHALPAILRPPPLPPSRLAAVPPTRGYAGKPGRTLQAVVLTLGDFARQFVLQALEALNSGSLLSTSPMLRGGGLRSGWFLFKGKSLTFHDYSYVPGVTISGTSTAKTLHLRIGGSAAAHGELRLGSHKALVGTLGGQNVHLARRPSATAAIVGIDAGTGQYFVRSGAAAHAVARRLAGVLAWLPGA
jgi:pimeloyl-ACP methyl ester carboxylesterase